MNRQEVSTLQLVRHRNIIELIDNLPDGIEENKHWVIMKLATGGELMHRIIDKFQNHLRYTEKEVPKAKTFLPNHDTCSLNFKLSFHDEAANADVVMHNLAMAPTFFLHLHSLSLCRLVSVLD